MDQQKKFRNGLLANLSSQDLSLLLPDLRPVELVVPESLERPNSPIKAVFFPESGIVSVVAVGAGHRHVEIGLIGREGMSGSALVHGGTSSPHQTYIQVDGEGHCLEAAHLVKAMRASSSLRDLFLRYAYVFMIQVSQTAVANAQSRLETRLARWLAMAHDRVDGNDLNLTHEFLALMLAVRRSGVTDSIAILEGKRIIKAGRGRITILNRAALEILAGPLYGVPEHEYKRLIGSTKVGTPPYERLQISVEALPT